MYNGPYAPWEHYPKTLRHSEIENPMSVVIDFFSADSLQGHGKRLKEWRYYVVNDEHYNEKYPGPGTLLFIYDLNLKILEATYLLLCDYRKFRYDRDKIDQAQLKEEKEQWDDYPENLSLKEQLDPYKAIRKVFKKIKPQAYRDYLHEWVHVALYNKADVEGLYAGEVITVYENLITLYSAAWMIRQRKAGNPHLKRCEVDRSVIATSTAPAALRTIKPDPSAAEKLALEELKNMIFKHCPEVQLIIHLGTYPEPFTFYLLVVVSDAERSPEHDISNKIEEGCKRLAHVFVLAYKAAGAKEALNSGKRFWVTAIRDGYHVYQSPELSLPGYQEITTEVLLEKAKLNWDRWGVQGRAFLQGAERYITENNFRLAAFLLHQSVESVLKGFYKL